MNHNDSRKGNGYWQLDLLENHKRLYDEGADNSKRLYDEVVTPNGFMMRESGLVVGAYANLSPAREADYMA